MTEITGMDVVNARLMAGLTRSAFASKLNMATHQIKRIESGEAQIDAAAVDAVVDAELNKLDDPGPGEATFDCGCGGGCDGTLECSHCSRPLCSDCAAECENVCPPCQGDG